MPYLICVIAFIISSLAIPSLISIANDKGAVSFPGNRHIHTCPTPKFGGIAIALSVLLISPFIFTIDKVIGAYLLASSLILILGIIDDLRGANWTMKLGFSLAATSILVFGGGIWITNLGNLSGSGDIQLGLWGIPFTYFAVFGVMNAINLIDGLNGLACGISSIAFLSYAVLASASGNETVLYFSLASLGAALGLLKYNYPFARIFMGDSGSLFLGFSLAALAILLTQGEGTINPIVPVLILGIPIFDTVRVLIIRIINKRPPFVGDKAHLHHLMLRSGMPPNRVVITIWIISSLASLLAFLLFTYDSWITLAVFCIVCMSIGIFINNLRILKLRTAGKKEGRPQYLSISP
jgi:UDP-GlcNAc:undecaprenyl-phosphate GlcNAc-1-phosphate transferase